MTDVEFERLLLDSARTDTAPSADATNAAWVRFAAAAAGTALLSGSAVGLAEATHSLRLASLKWFALGVVGGGLLTAGWFTARTPAPSVAASPARALPVELAATASVAAPHSAPPALAVRPVASAPGRRSPVTVRAVRPAQARSTLAAEIAALDDARGALAAGAPHRALTLIDAYRRDFPAGQLARDADALAIDALHAQGRHDEAARLASEFTRRYPGDPHAARLQGLTR